MCKKSAGHNGDENCSGFQNMREAPSWLGNEMTTNAVKQTGVSSENRSVGKG